MNDIDELCKLVVRYRWEATVDKDKAEALLKKYGYDLSEDCLWDILNEVHSKADEADWD